MGVLTSCPTDPWRESSKWTRDGGLGPPRLAHRASAGKATGAATRDRGQVLEWGTPVPGIRRGLGRMTGGSQWLRDPELGQEVGETGSDSIRDPSQSGQSWARGLCPYSCQAALTRSPAFVGKIEGTDIAANYP